MVADGPLAGVPFAVKDTLPEAGRPLGFGSRLLDGYVARREATLAERFRGAGLVSLVRTATPEFAFNIDTAAGRPRPDAEPVGPVAQPGRLERRHGGAGRGGRAADGSRQRRRRIDPHPRGLVRAGRAQAVAGPRADRARRWGRRSAGSRTSSRSPARVRDAAALLDAVSGPAPGDRYYVAEPAAALRGAARGARCRALRVAGCTSSPFGTPVDPHVRAAVEDVLRVLEQMGHQVVESCPPVDEQRLRDCLETTWSVDLAGLAGTFARIGGREAQADSVEAASRACIARGREVSALELEVAAATVNSVSRRWGGFLDEHQLFVCPTTPAGPPPSGMPAQDDGRVATAADWIDAVFAPSPFTPLANLSGPALDLAAAGRVSRRHADRGDADRPDAARGPAARGRRRARAGDAVGRAPAGDPRLLAGEGGGGGLSGDLGGDPIAAQRAPVRRPAAALRAARPHPRGWPSCSLIRNWQPWDFVLVVDREQLVELAKVWQGAGHVAGSAATVALVPARTEDAGERDRLPVRRRAGHDGDDDRRGRSGIGSGHSAVADQDRGPRRSWGCRRTVTSPTCSTSAIPPTAPCAPIQAPEPQAVRRGRPPRPLVAVARRTAPAGPHRPGTSAGERASLGYRRVHSPPVARVRSSRAWWSPSPTA